MNGFLTSIVQKQLRRLTLGAAISAAIVTASTLETGRLDEPEFNQAELAVEKAQFLLAPSMCGASNEKQTEVCEYLVKRAEELLARARQAVAAAATVADGGDVAVPRH